jgi:hypothetical protein
VGWTGTGTGTGTEPGGPALAMHSALWEEKALQNHVKAQTKFLFLPSAIPTASWQLAPWSWFCPWQARSLAGPGTYIASQWMETAARGRIPRQQVH